MIPLFGLSLLIAVVLSGTLFVAHPVVWNPMHRSVMEENYESRGAKGKLLESIFSDAEAISGGLWTEEPYEEISNSLVYRKMGEKEIYHFEDVRGLIVKTKWIAVICAGIALVGFGLVGFGKVWNAAVASFILLGIIVGIWMLIHWHSLFRTLHWIIFIDDTWILPKGCYSLLLFPHKVWKTAGGLMAAYVLCVFVLGYVGKYAVGKISPKR